MKKFLHFFPLLEGACHFKLYVCIPSFDLFSSFYFPTVWKNTVHSRSLRFVRCGKARVIDLLQVTEAYQNQAGLFPLYF